LLQVARISIAMSSRRSNNGRRPRRQTQVLVEDRKQTSNLQTINENTSGLTRTIAPTLPDCKFSSFSPRNHVYTFSREYSYATITASTSVDQAGAIVFTLGAFPNSSDFTNLFDVYRILETKVTFLSLTTGPYIRPLTTIIDYDDGNAVASLNELLEYDTQATSSSGTNHIRVLKPRASMAVYGGAFNRFASTPPGLWFDCANTDTQFYGVKYYLPALTGGTSTAVYEIRVRSILQFASTR
jgi:hypothetical protein